MKQKVDEAWKDYTKQCLQAMQAHYKAIVKAREDFEAATYQAFEQYKERTKDIK